MLNAPDLANHHEFCKDKHHSPILQQNSFCSV